MTTERSMAGVAVPLTWREELGLSTWDLVVLAATLLVAVTVPLAVRESAPLPKLRV